MEGAALEMPRYRCHKVVHALQIKAVVQSLTTVAMEGGSWDLVFDGDGFAPIVVSHAWYVKHTPTAGGYYVVYDDGYASFSPPEPFEAGYALIDEHQGQGIGWAIKQMHNGSRVTRAGWNGEGQWIALQVPDAKSVNTLPYVYIRTVDGGRVPWLASQTDLLARDWQIV